MFIYTRTGNCIFDHFLNEKWRNWRLQQVKFIPKIVDSVFYADLFLKPGQKLQKPDGRSVGFVLSRTENSQTCDSGFVIHAAVCAEGSSRNQTEMLCPRFSQSLLPRNVFRSSTKLEQSGRGRTFHLHLKIVFIQLFLYKNQAETLKVKS